MDVHANLWGEGLERTGTLTITSMGHKRVGKWRTNSAFKPLPPDPVRHQHSAIAPVAQRRGFPFSVKFERRADLIAVHFSAVQPRLCYAFFSSLFRITRSCSSLSLLTRYSDSPPLCGSCLV